MKEFEIKLAEDSHLGRAGQRVTLALQPEDVHDPTELATYLAGYKPFAYRADEMSPVILVDKDQDKYRAFDADNAFKAVDVKISTNGAVAEVDPKSSLTQYSVVERAIGSFVPRQTELNAGANYRPRMAAARRCRRAIDLDREIDVATLLETSGNWAAAQRLAVGAGDEWNDITGNSDPILNVQNAIEASVQDVTEIWMNKKVANAFLRHPSVRDHMRQALGDGPAQNIVGGVANAGMGGRNGDFFIPGIGQFRVSTAKVLNETTGAHDYILNDVAVLLTKPPGVPEDGEEIASSYTFRTRGPSGTGFETREFTVEGRGRLGGTMIVVTMADIAVMTGSNCGGIITNVHT